MGSRTVLVPFGRLFRSDLLSHPLLLSFPLLRGRLSRGLTFAIILPAPLLQCRLQLVKAGSTVFVPITAVLAVRSILLDAHILVEFRIRSKENFYGRKCIGLLWDLGVLEAGGKTSRLSERISIRWYLRATRK